MKTKIVYLALALTLVLSTAAALVPGMAGTGSAGLAQAEEGPAQPDAATEAGVEEALMKLSAAKE